MLKKNFLNVEELLNVTTTNQSSVMITVDIKWQLRHFIDSYLQILIDYRQSSQEKLCEDILTLSQHCNIKDWEPFTLHICISTDGGRFRRYSERQSVWPICGTILDLPPQYRIKSGKNFFIILLKVSTVFNMWLNIPIECQLLFSQS